MKILLFAYVIVSLVAGVDAWMKASGFIGVSGIAGPMLACWAGIGLRGSFIAGDRSQKIFGAVMTIIFLGIAHWLMVTSLYRVGLYGVSIGGGIWCLLGAFIGFITTNRSDTAPRLR